MLEIVGITDEGLGHTSPVVELEGGFRTWRDADLPDGATPLVDPTGTAATILDVRQDAEWATGHVPGALHVELGSIRDADLPAGPITVMCGHGERAMTAASILEASGRTGITVLDGGPADWANVTGASLETAP